MRLRQTQRLDSNWSAVKKKPGTSEEGLKQRTENKLNQKSKMSKTLKGITLKGSAELVAEFFSFGINSILYQRGIYPAETFTRVTQYDMSLHLTTDAKLKNYLTNVVSQLKEWLFDCTVQKLVVVITCLETNEVLERWQFDIECDKTANESSAPREKSIKAIQEEIRSVIRQITATVTFLPLLEIACK
ncbi:mitotic spindle assembly checkpoint protein MAD2A-like [Sinocyclocheilus grahami]|uniref:mitotic spindle assembly checkpoint protein MAD2A-like n=1 Tax=Sinocyclocheilus grahami TaxID=75366 RepID=UPI0007ACC28F|nr:PREDICTED: mitotic spindle assembly checkpoint protein MAD2A-like [Sinocyclocheilus grahami]